MKKRLLAVHKFYNFIWANKLTPIYFRQFNFFTNFVAQLKENSPRKVVFDIIQQLNNDFVIHYESLFRENQSKMDIKKLYHDKLISEVQNLSLAAKTAWDDMGTRS